MFLSVTSQTNVSYSGFRFYGEISEWPPHWNPSGSDVSVDVVASGIWRRLSALQTTLGSAYRRFTVNGAAATGLQSYWPMEDGSGSGVLVPFASAAGTGNATQQFVGGQSGLSLSSDSDFRGSDEIPVLNAAMIICPVGAGGTPTNNVLRFALSVPAGGDSTSGSWNLVEAHTAGTVKTLECYLLNTGKLQIDGVNNAGAIVFSAATNTVVWGTPYLVSLELTPSGGNVAFALRIIPQGAAGITESVTGTLTSASVGAVSQIRISRALALSSTAFGQLSVAYGAPTSLVQAAAALGGWAGELAVDRFTRICAEMGIASEVIGNNSQSAKMGPQVDDTLANVLQSIEDTDCGLLFETRDQFGVGYRTNTSMANQAVQATFNYAAATIDQSLAPAYDDSLTRNNITITNWTGYAQQAILTAGPMSVLNPPNGIGNGYTYTRSVNAAADTQVPGIANFLLNQGASDDIRFPVITINMIRTSSAGFFATIPGLDIGDYFQITNPPAFLRDVSAGAIRQLMWGYSETLNAKEWVFSFNAVPEVPWETGFSPGTIQTAQIPGGNASVSQAPGAGLGPVLTNGSITPSMLNDGITIRTLGGNAVTISVSPPATPGVGDIWINSSTGLISSWNGTVWAPTLFNATSTIQAATITSALIQAGTIVASNIAAGTITAATAILSGVFAGLVDATTIQAAQYIATGTQGEFLSYTGTPALGNLNASMSGRSSSDAFGNTFPAGIDIHTGGLYLDTQGSAPGSVSGSSAIYTSSQGRLRYLSSSGADLVLDRSALNGSNFSIAHPTTPTVFSGALNYLANEASVASEYEIEIDGTITTPTVTAVVFFFDMFVDGAALSASTKQGIGSVILQVGNTYNFTVRYRLTVDATGAGGSARSAGTGVAYCAARTPGTRRHSRR